MIVRLLCLLCALAWAASSRAQQSFDSQGNLNVHVQGLGGLQTPQWGPLQVSTPNGQPLPVLPASQYPAASTPITASATGTTGATTATMTGQSGRTMYICGFQIAANATAAVTGTATITGTVSGTMSFTQFTAPLASGIGVTTSPFSPCVPASGKGVSIAVVSAAPGTNGNVSVAGWGYVQ
jgi:hypothetical protein